MQEKKRLFFGLSAAAAQPELCRWQHALALPGKPVHPDNFHITLRFLGLVDNALLPALCAGAARLRLPAFSLCLDLPGWFARPRVAWLAPSHYPPALLQLAAALNGLADALALPAERRPYHAHVTLYRKLPPRPPPALQVTARPIPLQVSAFSLYESCSSLKGVRYVALASWPLQAPAADAAGTPQAQPH